MEWISLNFQRWCILGQGWTFGIKRSAVGHSTIKCPAGRDIQSLKLCTEFYFSQLRHKTATIKCDCNRQNATDQPGQVESRVMRTLVQLQDQEHRSKIRQQAAAALLSAEWCSERLPTDHYRHLRRRSSSLWRHQVDQEWYTSCTWQQLSNITIIFTVTHIPFSFRTHSPWMYWYH